MDRTAALTRMTCVLVALTTGCQWSDEVGRTNDRALTDTLSQLIARAYDFSRPGALQRMSALYPDSGQVVSASAGHMTTSPDSLRNSITRFWNNVGQNMRNPKWVWQDVRVERLSRNAAVLTGTWSIPHIAPTNQPHVINGAWTAVFRRIGGEWKIVQEHLSVPPS